MTAYIFKSALTLALLYSGFFLLLGRETFHRFNRFALVGIMIVSLVVPMIHVTTAEPTLVSEPMTEVRSFIEPDQLPVVASIPIKAEDIVLSGKEETERGLSFPLDIDWASLIALIYIIGIAVMLVGLALRTAMLVRLLRGGLRQTDSEGNTVILRSGDIAPFSVFRFIVMSVSDYERHRHHILTHEQAHIRLGHTYDLLLTEAVKVLQWFNPFVWLLARDLESVHEYEADEAVINKGIDATRYQQLLVVKAVGNRLQPFANNLSHSSLKQRITMMHKTKSPGAMMLKALFAIPAVAFAIYAFATPATEQQGTDAPSQFNYSDSTRTEQLVRHTVFTPKGKKPMDEYMVSIAEGTLVERDGQMFLEEIVSYYDFRDNYDGMTTTMMLNGTPFDKKTLPKHLTNKDLKKMEIKHNGLHTTVNLITTDVKIPAGVKDNVPREITLLLPGNGQLYFSPRKQPQGNWMNCSITSFEKNTWDYCIKDEFKKPMTKPGFKTYIYASTETSRADIDHAKKVMDEIGVTNYEVIENIPVRHYTDAELRQWALAEKAKGTPYGKLYDTMAPNGMPCADVKRQWHIVKAVYGKK